MPTSILPIDAAGPLLGALCIVLIAGAGVLHRRLRGRNRRVAGAFDNMSQGLCMFDAQGRIVLLQPAAIWKCTNCRPRSCGRAAACRR